MSAVSDPRPASGVPAGASETLWITTRWLERFEPCSEGLDWFCRVFDAEAVEVTVANMRRLLDEADGDDDVMWLIDRLDLRGELTACMRDAEAAYERAIGVARGAWLAGLPGSYAAYCAAQDAAGPVYTAALAEAVVEVLTAEWRVHPARFPTAP